MNPLAPSLLDPDAPAEIVRGAASHWPREGGDDLLERAAVHARRLIEDDRAATSREKYVRCWGQFVRWLGEDDRTAQYDPVPAKSFLVGLYIGALRERKIAKSTVLVHLAAIAYAHELAGFPPPWRGAPEIQRQIRGLRRQDDDDRQPRAAIEHDKATDLLLRLPDPKTPADIRDRALFCLTWQTALRRSNVAALRQRDIAIKTDPLRQQRYLEVFVRRSKTDQEARGRYVVVPELPGHHPLCAVRAVEALHAQLELDPDAPLFQSVAFARREGDRTFTGRPLDPKDVARIVKRLVAAAGEDPTLYAAHSLRRGFATSTQNAGVPDAIGMEHGGWKSKETYFRYNRVDKARQNPLRDIFNNK